MRLKLVFLMLLGLGVSSLAQAQLSVGLRGGLSSSSMSYRFSAGRPAVNTPGISAPTFAFVAEYFGQQHAGFQMELQFLTLGYSQTDTVFFGTNRTELDYLKIPMLSNFYFGNSGRFHIKLGPHIGYLLQAREVSRDFEGPNFLPTYGQPDDRPRKLMYGLTLGTGISKLFGKSTLSAEARFSYEFGRQESQNRIFDMNSSNLELSIAYLFRLTKPKWKKDS